MQLYFLVKNMKKIISILTLITLLLQPTTMVFAEETPSDTGELLILVEDSTNREIKNITKDAGGKVEDINTLNDGSKMAKISVDEEKIEEVTEILEDEENVIYVQPNYVYELNAEEAEENEVSDEEKKSEETEISEDTASETSEVSEPAELTEENKELSEESMQEEQIPSEAEEISDEDIQEELAVKGVPNDNDIDNQWYLKSIEAYDAWDKVNDGSSVLVAVIDSGCQLDHPDLNVLKDKCVTFNDGQKGSFTEWDNEEDDNGHGTHVCGIIAATTNNSEGIAGVSNNKAQLIVIDATNVSSSFTTQDVVLAIDYAIEQKAKLINLSLGGLYKDYILDNAVNNAYNNGVLCVCAAGNEASDLYSSPSDAYGAIGVMGHNQSGNITSTSNYGAEKDVASPGANIYSTYKNSSYKSMGGTSMATPIVTGVAALLLSEDPTLTPRQLKNLIYSSGDDDYGTYGFGKINAKKALESLEYNSSPSTIVLNKTNISLYSNEETYLEYAVYPGSAYSSSVTYKSSNPSVATVENGMIKAVSPGEANITVSTGSISSVCKVKVEDYTYKPITALPFTAEGSLDSKDPKVKVDKNIANPFESFMDGYEMPLEKDNKIILRISSSDMTPYLRVLRDGSQVAQKLYSGSSTPKVINVSYTPKVSGVYRFEILCFPTGEAITSQTYTFTVSHSHVTEKIEKKEATCTEDGWNEYYKCKTCGALFSDEGKTSISAIPVIKASHDWGNASYVWSGDSVTAKVTCNKNSSHVVQETVKASSSIIKEANCMETGTLRYTASFKNSAFSTQTKEVTTAKGDHKWNAPEYTWGASTVTAKRTCSKGHVETETVSFTKTVSGNTVQYVSDSFKNSAFEVQRKYENVEWDTPTYKWSADFTTVTGTHKDKNSSITESETVKVTKTVSGNTVYYVSDAFKNSAFTIQRRTETVTNDWSTPVYIWSADNSTVTATRKSSTATETETVNTRVTVLKSATCSTTGLVQYATEPFKNPAFSRRTKTVSSALASHEWGSPVYTWSSNYGTVTAKRTCKNGHVQTETVSTTSKVTKAATKTTKGETTYTSKAFRNSAFKVQKKTVANIPVLKPAPPKVICDLPAVKIKTITRSRNTLTVKWRSISKSNKKKIKGVQVQYSTNNNFASAKYRTVSKNSTSVRLTGLKRKTTYYVRIRTYNGNHISKWSGVRRIKTK